MKPVFAERRPAVSARSQYQDFRKTASAPHGRLLRFDGVGGADVYNPSMPFTLDGRTIMPARVQARDAPRSVTRFFVESDGVWRPGPGFPTLELEDPCVVLIGGELLLAGTRVIWRNGAISSWVTDFYRGRRLGDLSCFAHGPAHMKDIRLAALPDGRIALFSRPQGQAFRERSGCIARIGFSVLESLDELGPRSIEEAGLLEGHFLPDEWGGCNQPLFLGDGRLGVIGHKAYGEMKDGVQFVHYYCMAFQIDVETRWMTDCSIICSRDCFPEGPAREPRLGDVLFPAGIVRNGNGTANLLAGLSDCSVGLVEIADPFWEPETVNGGAPPGQAAP